MNDEENVNKRANLASSWQSAKRKSALSRNPQPTAVRWQAASNPSHVKSRNHEKCHESCDSLRWTNDGEMADHQLQNGNLTGGSFKGPNKTLCQPKPMKRQDLLRDARENRLYNQANTTFRRTDCAEINEFDAWERFAQELEDRIEAELEIESIFGVHLQPRCLSLSKSLPERPSNPIVNDKYFVVEEPERHASLNRNQDQSWEKQTKLQFLNYRECSLEKQSRIRQEDFEAETEINQLLNARVCQHDSSFGLESCSSDSSFENEFSSLSVTHTLHNLNSWVSDPYDSS